jgi:hypothetical protein
MSELAAIEYGCCASSSGLLNFAALEVFDHLVDGGDFSLEPLFELFQLEKNSQHLENGLKSVKYIVPPMGCPPLSFSLSRRFIAALAKDVTRSCHELRVAALDEITGFVDDFLHNIYQLAQAGLPIDQGAGCLTVRWILHDVAGGAPRACCGFVFHHARHHTGMLRLLEPESKGAH